MPFAVFVALLVAALTWFVSTASTIVENMSFLVNNFDNINRLLASSGKVLSSRTEKGTRFRWANLAGASFPCALVIMDRRGMK